MDLGAAAFVSKPFSVDQLAEVVRRVTPTHVGGSGVSP